MPITLSRRQIGDADRVGGIELLILWPDSLGPEPEEETTRPMLPNEHHPSARCSCAGCLSRWPQQPAPIRLDHEREAAPAEKAVAEALVRPACEAAGLVPVHVRVTRLSRPADLPEGGEARVHLAVTLIGRRWVHARGARRGRVAFAKDQK